jgi:hypothetical protein
MSGWNGQNPAAKSLVTWYPLVVGQPASAALQQLRQADLAKYLWVVWNDRLWKVVQEQYFLTVTCPAAGFDSAAELSPSQMESCPNVPTERTEIWGLGFHCAHCSHARSLAGLASWCQAPDWFQMHSRNRSLPFRSAGAQVVVVLMAILQP